MCATQYDNVYNIDLFEELIKSQSIENDVKKRKDKIDHYRRYGIVRGMPREMCYLRPESMGFI